MDSDLTDLAGKSPWPYVTLNMLEKSESIDRVWMKPQHQHFFPIFDHQNLYVPSTESSPCHGYSGLDINIKSNNGTQDRVTPSNPTPTLNISPERYVDISRMSLHDPLKVGNPAIAPTMKFHSMEPSSLAPKRGHSRLGRVISRKSKRQKFSQSPSSLPAAAFACTISSCRARFKRAEHVKRHMASHSREKLYVCWVPGCNGRFSRHDNLQTHY